MFCTDESFKKKYGIILGVLLTLLSGCRAQSVGLDTGGIYLYFFQVISNFDWREIGEYFSKDWTFWYGNKIISILFNNEFQVLVFLCSVVSLFFIIRYILRYSKDNILSYFIFVGCGYFALGMSMMRQYIAIALCVYAFDYIIKRNKKKFLLLVFFASSIHITAIFFIPAYFVAYNKMNIKNMTYYLILLSVSMFLGYYLILLATNMFFFGYYQPSGILEDEGGKATLFMVIGVLIAGLLYIKDIIEENKDNIVYYNLIWIAIIIQIQAIYMHDVSRVGYYYNFYVITFIPEIIKSIKNKLFKDIMYWGMVAVSIVVYFSKMYNLNGVYPYLFFWE